VAVPPVSDPNIPMAISDDWGAWFEELQARIRSRKGSSFFIIHPKLSFQTKKPSRRSGRAMFSRKA
jgi:hypothetical protein